MLLGNSAQMYHSFLKAHYKAIANFTILSTKKKITAKNAISARRQAILTLRDGKPRKGEAEIVLRIWSAPQGYMRRDSAGTTGEREF